MTDNSAIKQFNNLFLPIIILSKIVRYTVMRAQLVNMSIGWGILGRMLNGYHYKLAATGLTDMTNIASMATNNAGWMLHTFTLGIIEKQFGGDIFICYVAFEVVITIVFNIFLYNIVIGFLSNNPNIRNYERFFIYLSIAILNIFCLNVAKEPFQLVFFFMMAWAIKKEGSFKSKSVRLIGVLFLTVLFARKYYVMIIMYYLVLWFFMDRFFFDTEMKRDSSRSKIIMNVIFMFVLFGIFHFFLLAGLSEASEETYDELVAANTRYGAANSQILPLFGGGNRVMLTLDYFVKIFRLLLPVELIFNLKLTYLFSIIYQGLICAILIDCIRSINEENMTQKVALFLYLAFLLCSAAFEPDFGSWMRHQGVAFPVLLLMMDGKDKIEQLESDEQS